MEFTWQHAGTAVSMKRFLSNHGISMRLIKAVKHGEGQLVLNGAVVSGVITVNSGDRAGIRLADEAPDDTIVASQQPLVVLYEDANWLVVNKPAGLTSVPGPSNRTETLVNRVKGYLEWTHAPNQRPHLVTRLDRDTSGIVLIAKHRVAQGMLANPRLTETLKKTYTAWIAGTLTPTSGTIDQPIGRVDASPRRQVTAAGQRAVTRYQVVGVAADQQVSRLRLTLVTGRTHQIRVHLTSLGHPLLGDQLYGGQQDLITRQALHATSLSFFDPFSQTTLQVTAPLPADLQRLAELA